MLPQVNSELRTLQPPSKPKMSFLSIDHILGRVDNDINNKSPFKERSSVSPSFKDRSSVSPSFNDRSSVSPLFKDRSSVSPTDIDSDSHMSDERYDETVIEIDVESDHEIDINANKKTDSNKEQCDDTINNKKKQSSESTDKSRADEKQIPSYTSIIAQAILSSKEKKLPLGCIYEYISDKFPEFLKKGQGWRNCVRHNLSLSECFIKAGRARNGRGNYWGIHPRYMKNFSKGDFRKRRASHRPRMRDLGYANYFFPNYYGPFGYPPPPYHKSPQTQSINNVDKLSSENNKYHHSDSINTHRPWPRVPNRDAETYSPYHKLYLSQKLNLSTSRQTPYETVQAMTAANERECYRRGLPTKESCACCCSLKVDILNRPNFVV